MDEMYDADGDDEFKSDKEAQQTSNNKKSGNAKKRRGLFNCF